jgi:hypothetical protein
MSQAIRFCSDFIALFSSWACKSGSVAAAHAHGREIAYEMQEMDLIRLQGFESWVRPPRTHGSKDIAMAKVIEFYIPKNFRNPRERAPQLQPGKVIEFCPRVKKSA